MILLSPLALQVVPPAVLTALRNLSGTLLSHLQNSYQQSPSLLRAKLFPATHFLSILTRMLSVNATAHAAAKILAHPPDRAIMRRDWTRFVDCASICRREIPCGNEGARKVLEEDILRLLSGNDDAQDEEEEEEEEDEDGKEVNTESILDKWAKYFQTLPLRFHGVNPRMYILCAGAVASAALRAITMNGGEAFGAWWVVRCWVDEWTSFVAERGGFMSDEGVVDESEVSAILDDSMVM